MIASGETLCELRPLEPFCERTVLRGMTYGVGPAGYDVRIAEKITLWPGGHSLASTVEKFTMPNNLLGRVHDKSTWARQWITVQNTIIEPGWVGYLTLEIINHSFWFHTIPIGAPIAQIVFEFTDRPTKGYDGKYQDQKAGPQPAIFERTS